MNRKMKIGQYLVSRGLLSVSQAKQIAELQEETSEERFGKIAVRMGYITPELIKNAMRDKQRMESGR
jgi:hypothetical protein